MSYARWSEDSDVYVFLAVNGHLECCGCSLSDDWSYDTTDAVLAHLDEHKAAGHDVPDYCIQRLLKDRDENDAWIAHRRALPRTVHDERQRDIMDVFRSDEALEAFGVERSRATDSHASPRKLGNTEDNDG